MLLQIVYAAELIAEILIYNFILFIIFLAGVEYTVLKKIW